jgi:hypothetical protein
MKVATTPNRVYRILTVFSTEEQMTTFNHIHKRNEIRCTVPKIWPMPGSIREEVTWRGNFCVFPGFISRDYWKIELPLP